MRQAYTWKCVMGYTILVPHTHCGIFAFNIPHEECYFKWIDAVDLNQHVVQKVCGI